MFIVVAIVQEIDDFPLSFLTGGCFNINFVPSHLTKSPFCLVTRVGFLGFFSCAIMSVICKQWWFFFSLFMFYLTSFSFLITSAGPSKLMPKNRHVFFCCFFTSVDNACSGSALSLTMALGWSSYKILGL